MKCRGWKNLIDGCGRIKFASKKLWFESSLNPESRVKIQVLSIPIHFMGSESISDPFYGVKIHFFDLRCPVLIRKIDLLSRLWVKSWRIVSIYFRFLKIVCIWCILWLYETKWLPKGCRKVTERLPKGCCLGCKWLDY